MLDFSLEACNPKELREFILQLANKHKEHLTEELLDYSFQFIKYAWVGKTQGILGGIIFICYLPRQKIWTLDAYKDDKLLKNIDNKGDFSYRSGKQVIDWFFKNKDVNALYTMHPKINRGATIVSKRLGFKISGFKGNIVILKKERP